MPDIECFFDCSSPWTYFAFHNLLLLEKELGVEVTWRPILVGGVFNAVNPSVHNSREAPVPAKVAYGKKDQTDWARHLGIRMHYRPTVFPVNSVKAMRACSLRVSWWRLRRRRSRHTGATTRTSRRCRSCVRSAPPPASMLTRRLPASN